MKSYLVFGRDGEWYELPFDSLEYADVILEKDPVLGFRIHVNRYSLHQLDLMELCDALRCCSRYQPEVI